MKLAYTAGPYRSDTIHGTVNNIRAAERVAIKYWKSGYAVICPHKNSSLLDGACPDSVWLAGDLEMLSRCDTIIMIPGWEHSAGAKKELEAAVGWGKEVIYE